ncbi:MAG: MBL fold metallo-hydrolase [Bacteroidales bacterium]|nr:MBL fold metallo-hydrolase [Bacteroidales bacterium]
MEKPVADNISLQFLGAAGTVTGSKTLLRAGGKKILIDCGLFQGLKHLRELNWQSLPVDVSGIDAVILTHAHLDHTGYLPRLVNQGFEGPIYCSAPTRDITEVLLLDSAKIQEEDAENANRKGYTKHKPAKPLYDLQDAKNTIPFLTPQAEDEWFELAEGMRFRLQNNAHILGATQIDLDVFGKRIVFSGDIGRTDDPMLEMPDRPEKADYVIVESTYGDRLHPVVDNEKQFREILHKVMDRNGILIVPSFTVDRAQDFMYLFWKLEQKKDIPQIPIYLDSPMGIDVSKVFNTYQHWHKLGADVFSKVFENTKMVRSFRDTEQLALDNRPKIVIAGSGMMNGGRVLTYLKKHIGNPDSTIIIPGYQAEGTRGRSIHDGAHEIKIHGYYYPVKAHIEDIRTMSSHADQTQIINWLSVIKNQPEYVFINHGEPHSSDALRVKIHNTFGWKVVVPQLGDNFPIF